MIALTSARSAKTVQIEARRFTGPWRRPINHRTRDSIEAHLSVVFAAMAVSHWIEHQTGWSIKKFVRTARRYRTVTIQAGNQKP